jgi:two-component system, OmpR family, phosphate regulon sensor histidine kinase PhoR
MLIFKNLTPKQLSFFTAFILSISAAVGAWLLSFDWLKTAISFAIFLGVSYFLILTTLQRFIYRKIKLIYKFIYKTKASKREELYYNVLLPKKSIDEVKDDVETWAQQQEGEIALLKQNENFRKEFLQNLSHELKTPVFAIQGFLEALHDEGFEDKIIAGKFLQKASNNVGRMVMLLNDLDVISKLESGRQPLVKTSFVIQSIITDTFETLHIKATEKSIKCEIKKGCEIPITVYADKEKIRQVLTNLIDNAIKYSNTGATIEASIYKTDGQKVLVEISDDGIGIAEEHLPRLFERFYRTDAARTRKEGGSGLGLAICKHIVEAHGNSIHVRSKLNVGTTIGFTLDER